MHPTSNIHQGGSTQLINISVSERAFYYPHFEHFPLPRLVEQMLGKLQPGLSEGRLAAAMDNLGR